MRVAGEMVFVTIHDVEGGGENKHAPSAIRAWLSLPSPLFGIVILAEHSGAQLS